MNEEAKKKMPGMLLQGIVLFFWVGGLSSLNS